MAVVSTESFVDENTGKKTYTMVESEGIGKSISEAFGLGSYANAVVNKGESFIYRNGKWTDLVDNFDRIAALSDATSDMIAIDNFSIKAFGTEVKENAAATDGTSAEGSDESATGTETAITVAKPSNVKATAKKKAFKVSWKKVTGAKGYEVRYSLKSNMSKAKTVSTSATSKTVNKLKAKKKYFVQVRAYKLNSSNKKVYSKWSSKVSVKTKK